MTHSGAGAITGEVDITENRARAAIEDDGRGFEPGDEAPRTGDTVVGTGLTSMKERTALLGGTLELASAPCRGTRVEIFVPLPRRQH